MPQNKHENEIDLKALFNSVVARRFLVAGFTGFVTILAILYTNTLVQTYQATSSFKPPSKSSIININNLVYNSAAEDIIFSNSAAEDIIFSGFFDFISSRELQKSVFIDNDFLTILNKDNKPINNFDSFIDSILSEPVVRFKNKSGDPYLHENRYIVSMQGTNPDAISKYIDILVTRADKENVLEFAKLNKQKISIRLDQISIQSETLLEKAKQDRLNQIKRIKEEDGQKIRQINDQIDRARYKAKENRLNQIVVLTDAAKLAKSLGIIENNLNIFKDINAVNIAIGESNNLPDWYLYGEKALLQRIALLKNRTSDDAFIPEIVTLYNQLNEIQNNNLLQTLEQRMDDIPFISELVDLNIEKNKLLSMKLNLAGSSSITSLETAMVSTIPSNKGLIILLAFIGSFIMSILWALIMGALKPDEKTLA